MPYENADSLINDIKKQEISIDYCYGWRSDDVYTSNAFIGDIVGKYVTASTFIGSGDVPSFPVNTANGSTATDKSLDIAINKNLPNFSANNKYIIHGLYGNRESRHSNIVIVDLLVYTNGIIVPGSTVAGTYTTNLPTAALTRYTNGEGVMMGLSFANNATVYFDTAIVNYTNSDSNPGISPNFIANVARNKALFNIPLNPGDKGVKSIESVTINNKNAAGNANASTMEVALILYKPICMLGIANLADPCSTRGNDVSEFDFMSGNFLGGIPQINDTACLIPHISSWGHNEGVIDTSISGKLLIGLQ
jgi:hypothetical protein